MDHRKSGKPTYLSTLDYARRWGIEPMFSDFASRGFSLDDTTKWQGNHRTTFCTM